VIGFGAPSDQPFATSLNLTAGDQIDFSVGFGPNGTFLGDTLSLQATFTTVPEPGTLSLLAVGAVGWLMLKRRSRHAKPCAAARG
jgi:hypothetical protein